MQKRLISVSFAAVVFCMVAAMSASAEPWRSWSERPDSPLSARFEPFLDTRLADFDRNNLESYSDWYWRTPYPGEVVLSPIGGGAGQEPTGGGPLDIVVEAVVVPVDEAGKPSVAQGDHFAANPHLPFGLPAGSCGRIESSFVRRGAKPDADGAYHAPVILPMKYSGRYRDDTCFRVRWRILKPDSGAEVARGVLPCAFSYSFEPGNMGALDGVVAYGDPKRKPGDNTVATRAAWNAWPALVSHAANICFDEEGFDSAFSGLDGSNRAAAFVSRARLANVPLAAKGEKCHGKLRECGWAEDRTSAVVTLRPGDSSSVRPIREALPCQDLSLKADKKAENAEKLAGARIPGSLLGRSYIPFVVSTVLFLAVFAAGTVFLLVRFFAFEKGEVRTAVWKALPAWCAVCAAFGYFVLPQFCDRRPFVDITEVRYCTDADAEAYCSAIGRIQHFFRDGSEWTVPQDAWFEINRSWRDGSLERFRVCDGGGKNTLQVLPCSSSVGENQRLVAHRFSPCRHSVAVSPDPVVDLDGWAQEALHKPGDPDSDPELRKTIYELLSGLDSATKNESALAKRSVTALEDLDGVFVYTRGTWYSLGSMTNGQMRTLKSGMKIWSGMETDGRESGDLFDLLPLGVSDKAVKSFANAWIERENRAGKAAAGVDEDENAKKGVLVENYSLDGVRDVFSKLASACIITVKGSTDVDSPFLVSGFTSSGKAKTTSRIVSVEVFK